MSHLNVSANLFLKLLSVRISFLFETQRQNIKKKNLKKLFEDINIVDETGTGCIL